MKKICHISSVHKVNDVRIFHKQCKTLASYGHKVTLIACQAEVRDPGGVRILCLPAKGSRLLRMLTGTFNAYRIARKERADVYHFHDPELLPYGLLLKMGTQAAVVYDSHECSPEDFLTKEWLPVWLRKTASWGIRVLEDAVARRIDLVVAATPHIAERFRSSARRVETLNNFPLKDEFASRPESRPTEKTGFCYVGTINEIRGILELLDALDYVDPRIEFYLAGSFATPESEALAKAHRNWPRVLFAGLVDRQGVAAIYDKSLIGIVNFLPAPNHVFSQPNKLFEYMSSGIAVVASNFPLWKTIIEDQKCGFCVDPESPEKIGLAIQYAFDHPEEVRRMGQRGQRAVQQKYNWEKEGQKLIHAYEPFSLPESSTPPKVSVVIPSYNHLPYVEQAIRSVLGQVREGFTLELVVIDDGSTDGSPERLRQLEAETGSAFTLVLKENEGLCRTLNRAIREHTTGTHVAVLASDDIWHPEKLARQMRVLRSNPENELCYSNAMIFGDVKKEKRRQTLVFRGAVKPWLTLYNFVPAGTMLFTRRLFERVGGFDETGLRLEDWDFLLRAADLTKFSCLNENLLYYRCHDQSTLTRMKANGLLFQEKKKVLEKNKKNLSPLLMALSIKLHYILDNIVRSTQKKNENQPKGPRPKSE